MDGIIILTIAAVALIAIGDTLSSNNPEGSNRNKLGMPVGIIGMILMIGVLILFPMIIISFLASM